jgi:GTP-binding protein Era
VPVSARTGEQLDVLLRLIVDRLPEGPPWYPDGQRTDQTTAQRIPELIREQALLATYQEVPHAVAVQLEECSEQERLTVIRATILVERPGQKAILIGKGGAMLKRIGQAARLELERLLGRKVFLELWVKVAEEWRSDTRRLRELGYGS